MAIARGAGTEIIRTALFEDVAGTSPIKLIVGIQHHTYTVLSASFYLAERSGTEKGYFGIKGYDAFGGTTNQTIWIADIAIPVNEIFIWNDKFSFNGFEPVDFSGPMDDGTKQDAISDQGSGVSQYLFFQTGSSNTKFDITITYIDQNNA